MSSDKKWCGSTVQLDNQLSKKIHWQVQHLLTAAVRISTDPKFAGTRR
jgi:hypothetical protein